MQPMMNSPMQNQMNTMQMMQQAPLAPLGQTPNTPQGGGGQLHSDTPNQYMTDSIIGDYDVLTEGTPREQLKKYLEPYSREEVQSLLVSISTTDDAFCRTLLAKIQTDKKWCKLFVHGLAFSTSKETLETEYAKFGEVKEAVVLVDKKGQSKGYGFVTFGSAKSALKAAHEPKKRIDSRITHCNLAFKGNPKKFGHAAGSGNGAGTPTSQGMSPKQRESANDRRLFVHSLAWKTEDAQLALVFSTFGNLQEAVVIRDKKTGKSKGYGFVTFKYSENAKTALLEPNKKIDGRQTHCNYACERSNVNGGQGGGGGNGAMTQGGNSLSPNSQSLEMNNGGGMSNGGHPTMSTFGSNQGLQLNNMVNSNQSLSSLSYRHGQLLTSPQRSNRGANTPSFHTPQYGQAHSLTPQGVTPQYGQQPMAPPQSQNSNRYLQQGNQQSQQQPGTQQQQQQQNTLMHPSFGNGGGGGGGQTQLSPMPSNGLSGMKGVNAMGLLNNGRNGGNNNGGYNAGAPNGYSRPNGMNSMGNMGGGMNSVGNMGGIHNVRGQPMQPSPMVVGMQPTMQQMHPAPPSVPTMGMPRHQPATPTFTHSTPAYTGNMPNMNNLSRLSTGFGAFQPNGPPNFQSKPGVPPSFQSSMPNFGHQQPQQHNGHHNAMSSIPMAFQKKIVTAAAPGPPMSHINAMGAGSAMGVGRMGVGVGQMTVTVPAMNGSMKMAGVARVRGPGNDGNCSPKSQASEGDEVNK